MSAPFLRLALIASCSSFVFGLVIAADWAGFSAVGIALLGGIMLAVALAEDWERKPGAPRRRLGRPRRETSAYDGEE